MTSGRPSIAPLLFAITLLLATQLGCNPGAATTAAPQSPAPSAAGESAPSIVTYPDLPGATRSPLYAVTANGKPLFVEKLSKFSPEMQVHYAHCSLSGPEAATFSVTVNEEFSSHTLSPRSKNIATARSGNTLTFSSGPNYLILQVDAKELLFILVDAEEANPPRLGDANVKNIADYGVDNTGATLVTSKVQAAIDAASGAEQNVLYFPPGKYTVGELWLKSDMTLYLAGGALLYGSNSVADFDTGSGGINIEGCSHGMLRMYRVKNSKIRGRGVIDGNGVAIRGQKDTKINLLKIEESSNILIDGVTVRDPSFWNTLVYRSDLVTIQNYKMINCRPITKIWNNTDGVNFDESTNGKLSNAFLYTGDDSMAVKNEEAAGTVNTKNVIHEKVVCYSNSVCAKIGTKTMGQSMDGIVFRDIDVVKAGRALNIDAYDTAVVQNTRFEDIRIEAADSSIIALSSDDPPSWRTAANQSIIKDTLFRNVTSHVKKPINLHGRSSTVNIVGVRFENLTVEGNAVTSPTDPDATWSINPFVSGIEFVTRPPPPTRAADGPGAPPFTKIPFGNAPLAEGDFVIGPNYSPAPELTPKDGVPVGRVLQFTLESKDSKFYPGIARDVFGTPDPNNPKSLIVETHPKDYQRTITVYVPAQYQQGTKAPLIVTHDGPKLGEPDTTLPRILDNLIAQKRVPPMVAVMIQNGGGDAQGSERGLEYDTMSGKFAEFIEAEVLPAVEKNANVELSRQGKDRAVMGCSSGAAAAFTMAWNHPEWYQRVISYSGTYVNQQWPFNPATPGGAWEYHNGIIAASPVKPIRIWMHVGDRDLYNPNVMRDDMHDWVAANHRFAAVLKSKGYHYQYVFALDSPHCDRRVREQTLPAALEFVWKDE